MATVAKDYDVNYAWRAVGGASGGRLLFRGLGGGEAAGVPGGPGSEKLHRMEV